jgi:hypothetical protein
MACKVISIRKYLKELLKIHVLQSRMQAANLEGITLDSSRCLVDPWTSATRLFYKLIYLLTYTSNQNEKLCALLYLS